MKLGHLLWIIPLSLIVGGYLGLTLFGNLLDFTMTELTLKAANKLEDCVKAYEEKPLSDHRIFYQGEFCYKLNDQIICPKRNLTDLSLS